jgi:uncharacterized repeat protein (TIGR03803 family)
LAQGTVFKITPAGKLTTLYNFCSLSNCADGFQPSAGLIQATDGNLYGTTFKTGSPGLAQGTVFKITPAGKLTTLNNFCSLPNCSDGAGPVAALVQGADGYLYGTTSGAGSGDGTVFKITVVGKLTTIYNLCSLANCSDGDNPSGALVQATDGNFYGTTWGGGELLCGFFSGCGTVFKITPGGVLTTLLTFFFAESQSLPVGGLLQGTNGTGRRHNQPCDRDLQLGLTN